MQFCEYLKLDCSFTSDTNYHRIMEGFGLEELHHQFCSWELTANKSPVLCSKHHSKNCAHRGSVETFCNKHWVWETVLKMHAQNWYWWTSHIQSTCSSSSLTPCWGAACLPATLPLIMGLAQIPAHSLCLAHSAHTPPQLTAVSHDTLTLSVSWQTLTKGRKGLLRIWALLMWASGYAWQDYLNFLAFLSSLENPS